MFPGKLRQALTGKWPLVLARPGDWRRFFWCGGGGYLLMGKGKSEIAKTGMGF